MDTSEQYIKMCEKAVEVQGAHQWKWDDLWFDKFNTVIKHFDPHERVNKENSPVNRDYYWQQSDNMVWLPRQDQLQEMVTATYKGHWVYLVALWHSICMEENTQGAYDCNASMEQLWLAFVMKEKYNKVWNGEDWTSTSPAAQEH